MSRGEKLVLSILAVFAIVCIVVGGVVLYRNSGPTFTFRLPESISPIRGEISTVREVSFPNVFPGQLGAATDSKRLFEVGDIIEIDMGSPSVSLSEDRSSPLVTPDGSVWQRYILTVEDRLSKDVRAFYYFDILLPLDRPDDYTVRIFFNGPDISPGEAFHQNDDTGHWFVLREWYKTSVRDELSSMMMTTE